MSKKMRVTDPSGRLSCPDDEAEAMRRISQPGATTTGKAPANKQPGSAARGSSEVAPKAAPAGLELGSLPQANPFVIVKKEAKAAPVAVPAPAPAQRVIPAPPPVAAYRAPPAPAASRVVLTPAAEVTRMVYGQPPPPLRPGEEGPVLQAYRYTHHHQDEANYIGASTTLYPIVTCNIVLPFYSQGMTITQSVVLTCCTNCHDSLWIRDSRATATSAYLHEMGWDPKRDYEDRTRSPDSAMTTLENVLRGSSLMPYCLAYFNTARGTFSGAGVSHNKDTRWRLARLALAASMTLSGGAAPLRLEWTDLQNCLDSIDPAVRGAIDNQIASRANAPRRSQQGGGEASAPARGRQPAPPPAEERPPLPRRVRREEDNRGPLRTSTPAPSGLRRQESANRAASVHFSEHEDEEPASRGASPSSSTSGPRREAAGPRARGHSRPGARGRSSSSTASRAQRAAARTPLIGPGDEAPVQVMGRSHRDRGPTMAQPLTAGSTTYRIEGWEPLRQNVASATSWNRVPGQLGIGICRKWNTNVCDLENCPRAHVCTHCLQNDGHMGCRCNAPADVCAYNIAANTRNAPAPGTTQGPRPAHGKGKGKGKGKSPPPRRY
jgi:hypothetical protein